jgi:hypothetical protein
LFSRNARLQLRQALAIGPSGEPLPDYRAGLLLPM